MKEERVVQNPGVDLVGMFGSNIKLCIASTLERYREVMLLEMAAGGLDIVCVDEINHKMSNMISFPDLSVPNDKPLINDIRNFGLSERDKRKAQWKMNKRS